MGTDIHGGAEWKYTTGKYTTNQEWGFIAAVPDVRNYQVFNILANVRDEALHSIADDIPHRGIPDVMSYDLHKHMQMAKHSITYYSLDELNAYKALFVQIDCENTKKLWLAYIDYLTYYSKARDNVEIRVTIGFDS